jgi:hypothetical protein
MQGYIGTFLFGLWKSGINGSLTAKKSIHEYTCTLFNLDSHTTPRHQWSQ